jgi:tetratricopeptide (TPR) repeat protein
MKAIASSALLAALLLLSACLRSPESKAAQFLASGKGLMDREDYARAALEYKNAVRLLPKDAEAEYQLGLAYLADGRLADGVAALTKATALNPKHAAAQVKIAELMALSGDPSVIREGEKRAQGVLAATPGNPDALNALALSELALGNPQDAERHLEEALQKLPQNFNSSVTLARVYLSRNDAKGAEEILKKAADAAPQSVPAALALAQMYLLTSRWADAGTQFRAALKVDPKDPRALLGLATAQVQLGQMVQAEETYRTVSGLPGKRYEHLHAAYLFSQGQRAAAIQEFEKLAKANLKDRDSRNRLVAALLVSGRISDAEKVLAEALKANPKDSEALLYRSNILLKSGKDREAEADLNQVLHYRTDSAGAHYLLAHVHRLRGDDFRVRSELAEAVRLDPNLLAARLELAQALTLSNSAKAALNLLDAAPGTQKNMLGVILERNLAKLGAGDAEGFRAGVRQALTAGPIPDVLLQDAVGKLLDRNYAGARGSLQEVLRQNPENVRALKATALSYTAEKQAAAATRFLQGYAAQHPKSAAIQQFAGEWFWTAGAHDQARVAFLAAKAADPKYIPADLALARADLADGKLEAARTTLSGVLAIDDRNLGAHLLLASVELSAGNTASALAEYRKAAGLNPRNPLILNNLAYLMIDLPDQADGALAYAQQAMEAAPDSPDVAGTLGWVLYRKGLYPSALQNLEKAVSNDHESSGRNAVIRKYHLAMTCFKLGDRKRGQDLLLQAHRQDPKLLEAEMAQAARQQGGR